MSTRNENLQQSQKWRIAEIKKIRNSEAKLEKLIIERDQYEQHKRMESYVEAHKQNAE